MPPLSAARAAVVAGFVVGVATAGVVTAPPASALPAPTVSASTVVAGETFTVSGTGCIDAPGAPLPTVTLSGSFTIVAPVNASGAWSVSARYNISAAGQETISVACKLSSGNVPYPSIPMWVKVAPVPVPTGTVPTPSLNPPPTWTPPPVGPRRPWTPPPGMETYSRQTTARPTIAVETTTVPSSPSTGLATAPPPPTPTTSFSAAPDCPDCERLTADEPLTAGADLTLRYAGFLPDEQVTVVMRSTPVELGTFPADASGVVTATFTLPDSAEAGSHTLTFSGPVTGDRVVRFRLAATSEERETAAAPAPPGTDRPLPLILGGALVLLLSAGGLVWRRRRSARTHGHPGAPGQPTETPIAEPIA